MLKRLIPLAFLASTQATGHEFWLEPVDYTLASSQQMLAEVRSGESFEGDRFPFMPERIVSVEVIKDKSRSQITGQRGDLPALQHTLTAGLHIISYQSTPTVMTHLDYAEFRNFLEEDGLQWVDEAHKRRQLPTSGFREMFTRYAKSLVSVDGVAGHDQPVGLPYEIVVMNPLYDSDDGSPIELQLLAEGQPVHDIQVTIFQKYAESQHDKSPLKLRTDTHGAVSFPVGAGGEFLASAVIMKESSGIPWHSHWTSVTFAMQ